MIILLVVTLASFHTKAQSMSEFNKNQFKGTWMLQREFQSPWNSIIVPIFMDFDSYSSQVFTCGYDEKEGAVYKYNLIKDSLKIGDYLVFNSVKIYDDQMIVSVDDIKLTYRSLTTEPNDINATSLVKVLANHKWNLGDGNFEFKGNLSPINIPNSFDVIEYKNGKPFFGVYSIIAFKKHLFLLLLIDGNHFETVYRVKTLNTSQIELEDLKKQLNILMIRND